MDLSAVVEPVTQRVSLAVSFRVETSGEWTGCACMGANITSVDNQQAGWNNIGGECIGGRRMCSELYYYDSSKGTATNTVAKSDYRPAKAAAGTGCKLPPSIVLPHWRGFAPRFGTFQYRGTPTTCDSTCMHAREKGYPNKDHNKGVDIPQVVYHGCDAYGEHGSPLANGTPYDRKDPRWKMRPNPNTCDAQGAHCWGLPPAYKSRNGANEQYAYNQVTQPIGFLSKLGAEGKGAVLAVFQGEVDIAGPFV